MKSQIFDGKDLAKLGATLYGQRWQTALARAMGISPRYVAMLVNGERRIPLGLVCDLQRLAYERVTLIDRWHERLVRVTRGRL